jgi:hypothetical protein
MIRSASPELIDDFADWFTRVVAAEDVAADPFRDELRMSYATVFEFVMIGAADLEDAAAPSCAE